MAKNIFLVLFFAFSSFSYAEYTQVSRYLEVKMKAKQEQVNPLYSVVRVEFPVMIITVKDAIDYVLDDTGYEVVHEQLWTKEMSLILSAKISHTQRDLKNTPLKILDVIDLIVGEAFYVVRDPIRRKISVVLKDEYRGLIDE